MSFVPNNTSVATFDYLNALPVEMWREILVLVTPCRVYATPSTNPLDVARRVDHEKLQDAQADRALLLTICKSFLPIIEELLYSEVILEDAEKLEIFLRSAARRLPDRRSHGEWTTTLFYDVYNEGRTDPKTFTSSCPNLRNLSVFTFGAAFVQNCWSGDWCNNLTTLLWSADNLKWRDLEQISIHCHRLTHLKLHGMGFPPIDADEPPNAHAAPSIVFSELHRFDAHLDSLEEVDISRISMPSLNCLCIDALDGKFGSLLERYGDRITTLEIESLVAKASELVLTGESKELFNKCTALETFIFRFDQINAGDPSKQFVPHKRLKTLMLRAFGNDVFFPFSNDHTELLEGHAKLFSEQNFPNVSTVFIELRGIAITKSTAIRAQANRMFPSAFIEICDDFHWPS